MVIDTFFFSPIEKDVSKCMETSQEIFSSTGDFSLDPPGSCPLKRKYTTQLLNEKLGIS